MAADLSDPDLPIELRRSLCCLSMAQSFQESKPPENSGRFTGLPDQGRFAPPNRLAVASQRRIADQYPGTWRAPWDGWEKRSKFETSATRESAVKPKVVDVQAKLAGSAHEADGVARITAKSAIKLTMRIICFGPVFIYRLPIFFWPTVGVLAQGIFRSIGSFSS